MPPPPPPAPPQQSELPRHLATASKAAGRQLLRPRVRLALVGVAALIAAGFWVDGSLGTLLTIAGVVMLAIAWLGSRVEGGLHLEWGADGTRIGFDNRLAPAPEPLPRPVKTPLNPPRAAAAPVRAASLAAVPPPPVAPPADVESEAHTVEIDVAELKALIAAAERRDVA